MDKHALSRMMLFLLITAILLGLWWVQTWGYDQFQAAVSWDYVVPAVVGSKWFFDWGLFLATFLGACWVLPFHWPLLPNRLWLPALIVLPLGVWLLTLAGGAAWLAMYRLDLLDTSHWSLAYPTRHSIYLGSAAAQQSMSVLLWSIFGVLILKLRFSANAKPSPMSQDCEPTESVAVAGRAPPG